MFVQLNLFERHARDQKYECYRKPKVSDANNKWTCHMHNLPKQFSSKERLLTHVIDIHKVPELLKSGFDLEGYAKKYGYQSIDDAFKSKNKSAAHYIQEVDKVF